MTNRAARAHPGRPSPAQRLGSDGFQLADVAEGERAKKRAQRGWRHDPVRKNTLGRPRSQHVGVVYVASAGDDRMDQRQHLAPRSRSTYSTGEADGGIDQRLQPEADHQGAHQQKASVGHQVGLVEAHPQPVDAVRYCPH